MMLNWFNNQDNNGLWMFIVDRYIHMCYIYIYDYICVMLCILGGFINQLIAGRFTRVPGERG